MDTKELVVYHGSQGKGVECLHNPVVNCQGILVAAFKSEREMFCQATTLVISTKKVHFIRVVQLQGNQVDKTFQGKVATIDVVTQEEEAFIRWLVSGNLKHFNQVIVLAVNVTNN